MWEGEIIQRMVGVKRVELRGWCVGGGLALVWEDWSDGGALRGEEWGWEWSVGARKLGWGWSWVADLLYVKRWLIGGHVQNWDVVEVEVGWGYLNEGAVENKVVSPHCRPGCFKKILNGIRLALLQTDESSSKTAENISSLFKYDFFFQITIKRTNFSPCKFMFSKVKNSQFCDVSQHFFFLFSFSFEGSFFIFSERENEWMNEISSSRLQ